MSRALRPSCDPAPTVGDGERTWSLARYFFLRALGVALIGAFLSLWHQGLALVGSQGLTPMADTMARFATHLDIWSAWRVPTLFWVSTSDAFIQGVIGTGLICSTLLTAGVLPRLMCAVCYVSFLSFAATEAVASALDVRWFNWPGDNLMTEATFLAIFLAPPGWLPLPGRERPVGRWVRYLLYWLTFRLFFGPGIAKVINDDQSWHQLTALKVFYETLPSPTSTAATMFDAPMWLHRVFTLLTLAFELVGAACLFVPGWWRRAAGVVGIGMMVMVQVTGNFRGLAIMSVGLLAMTFDDQWLLRRLPARCFARLRRGTAPAAIAAPSWLRAMGVAGALAVALAGAVSLSHQVKVDVAGMVPGLKTIARTVSTFGIANSYAMFAAVPKDRLGLVVQGSQDGATWHDYEPLGAPCGTHCVPRRLAPYSDFLGFALWVIAPLPSELAPGWLTMLQQRLLEGDRGAAGLFAAVPFGDCPPRWVRVARFGFKFTSPDQRRDGVWWHRQYQDVFLPPRSLSF